MKAAFCVTCCDIIAAWRDWRTNRAWRWCQCEQAGLRWVDGDRGRLEVTSRTGRGGVRVIGLNNQFLLGGIRQPPADSAGWREMHTDTARRVGRGFLFHMLNRNCWAVIVRPGESADVTYVEFAQAKDDPDGQRPQAQVALTG